MHIYKKSYIQISILFFLASLLAILINNLLINLSRAGLELSFSWLLRPSSFALAEHPLPFSPSDSYAWALFMGWLNSLKVIFNSLVLATLIGLVVGIMRTAGNSVLVFISAIYITFVRQTPLLLQLMFWYFVAFLGLKENILIPLPGLLSISNQGIEFLGLNLSSEFSALLFGLSVFTGAYIAEVVRGGIMSVPRGQWEAFRSLGLSETNGLFRIIIPQAMPAIIPGLTSQYLNLAKNSTLAIAVGYADIYAVNDTIINQTGRAIESFIVLLTSFYLLNLLISNLMEMVNKMSLHYIRYD